MSMPLLQTQLSRQCRRGPLAAAIGTRSLSMFGFGSSGSSSSPPRVKESYSTTPSVLASSKPVAVESCNKQHICKEVATSHDLSMAQAERIVNTVFDTIVDEVVVGGKRVRIANFGVFETYMSKPTTGRNPNTGVSIEVPSKRRIRFKAFEGFKNAGAEK